LTLWVICSNEIGVTAPSAKSLILDLLGTMPPETAMPIAALVEAGDLFGVGGNAVRVAVARLTAVGRVVRDERGQYLLGERALPVGRRVRSWRDLAQRTRPWRGEWLGVLSAPSDRTGHRQRDKALRLFGFARLQPGLWLRPDNLPERVDAVRAELTALGLPPGDLVACVHGLAPTVEAQARGLWDVPALRRSYRRSLTDLAASTKRLGNLSAERAMVESFLLGGRVIRELVLDPLLPDEICPGDDRRALVESLRAYDRTGRLAWATLMERWGLPSRRAPVDARADQGRGRVATG
jgi:phenylacetic acid degradation operon negative regulatory protein